MINFLLYYFCFVVFFNTILSILVVTKLVHKYKIHKKYQLKNKMIIDIKKDNYTWFEVLYMFKKDLIWCCYKDEFGDAKVLKHKETGDLKLFDRIGLVNKGMFSLDGLWKVEFKSIYL